jgi:hypothetical protein
MNKKLLFIAAFCCLLLLLGGCPIPVDVAICGNNICESGEANICPSDCVGQTSTSVSCDATCSTAEMCVGYFGDGEASCCVGNCNPEISEIAFTEGWNFVSFPLVELNDAPEDIFAGVTDTNDPSIAFLDAVNTIYSYQNEEWVVWHNAEPDTSNLDRIEAVRGYVVIMDGSFTMSLDDLYESLDSIMESEGSSRSPHDVDVWAGWNLVGSTYGQDDDHVEKPLEDFFDSIEGAYSSLWKVGINDGDLEEISINDNENLLPTYTYWLYMDADGEIIQ